MLLKQLHIFCFAVMIIKIFGMRLKSSVALTTTTTTRMLLRQYSIGSGVDVDIPNLTNVQGKSVALHIFVAPEIRSYLKLKSRKSRILVPSTVPDSISRSQVQEWVVLKFPTLRDHPFVLRYYHPDLSPTPRQFKDDADVYNVLKWATLNDQVTTMQLFVDVKPGEFPPPSEPYLKDMKDPLESDSFTVLSFYRFVAIDFPDDMIQRLEFLWKPFRSYGRVYIAKEGINAQMAVPTNVLDNFRRALDSVPALAEMYLNIDHIMSRVEFEAVRPFKALHIRHRDQIVADGFDRPLDWEKAGREVPPLEWHSALSDPEAIVLDCRNSYESDVGKFDNAVPLNTTFFRESWDVLDELLDGRDKNKPILTYCTGGIRCVKINAYIEQKLGFKNVGRLQGGIISYTKEVLSKLDSTVAKTATPVEAAVEAAEAAEPFELVSGDVDQAAASMEYQANITADDTTTASAVSEVAQSVTASALIGQGMTTEEQGVMRTKILSPHLTRIVSQSRFRGVNYVFDERMGAAVTADVFSMCETCGNPCASFTNCRSFECHVRFIQCGRCASRYDGCCSAACKDAFTTFIRENPQTNGFSPGVLKKSGQAVDGSNMAAAKQRLQRTSGNVCEGILGGKLLLPRAAQTFAVSGKGVNNDEQDVQQITNPRTLSADNTESALAQSPSPVTPLPIHPKKSHAFNNSFEQTAEALASYSERMSSPEPALLAQLRKDSEETFAIAARMVSSPLQGRILSFLASACRAEAIMELGSFTGYSALCFAEGMLGAPQPSSSQSHSQEQDEEQQGRAGSGTDSGSSTSREGGFRRKEVMTCDIDPDAIELAQKYIALSGYGSHITLCAERATDMLVRMRAERRRFDIIFIDADKKFYKDYLRFILGEDENGEKSAHDPLIREGGIVIVDNTLWKGLVLAQEPDLAPYAPEASLFGKAARMTSIASAIHTFNSLVRSHPRLQPLLLPVRDGLSVMQYRGPVSES